MTAELHRPRGRRPGRADTKSAIQAAALELFAGMGYEKVSLRAIARAAEVDPALIHHYFENKADLFARSVLDMPLDAEGIVHQILDGPPEKTGERTIAAFLEAWSKPGVRERTTAMLRASVTGPAGQRPMSEFMAKEVLLKVTESLGHSDAKLRAQLAVSLLLGLALSRDIAELPALVKARPPVLIKALGRAMQDHLVEPW